MVFTRSKQANLKQKSHLAVEARRKRKQWRQELARKGGSTPKSSRQNTGAEKATGEGTSTHGAGSASSEPNSERFSKPSSTTPIRKHVRVRPVMVDKAVGPDVETVDAQTQTGPEPSSITRLCAELNKAKRRISTLENQLQLKKDQLRLLKTRRAAQQQRSILKRVSSLEDLSRKSRTKRAKKIAKNIGDIFRPETLVPEIEKIVRQARHQLNFISPKKAPSKWTKNGRTRKAERLCPILDIQVCLLLGLSWRQRAQLKQVLINTSKRESSEGLDFLASTHEVNTLRRRLTRHARFAVHHEGEMATLVCLNVKEVLTARVETLWNQGRLRDDFDGKLMVAVVGDRGCGSVKIGLQIGNLLADVNSPRNTTLIAFWNGGETRAEMETRLIPVLEQLEQIGDLKLEEAGKKFGIEWFLTGDMAFICAWLGHMGPASVFPCALCRVPYRELGGTIVGQRTVRSMNIGAAIFRQRTGGSGKHTTADSIASGSQKALPLFAVPPTNVIPSPFHTLHSAGRKCIDFFEKNASPEEKARLEEIAKKSGAIRHAKTQEYTGNQMKRLLLAADEIRSIGTQFSRESADLLDNVRELHVFGRAVLMTSEQVKNFSAKCFAIESYFKTLWECNPCEQNTDNASGFTPKLHWLLAHGPDFARRWGWFAWISEQGIEHLHHVLNKQSERFRRYKGDELLLKIGEHQTLINSVFDRHLGWL